MSTSADIERKTSVMKIVMKLIGILFILLGIIFLFNTDMFFDWIEDEMGSNWFYISAIITRMVFGILFIVAAKESKFPSTIKILGFIFILFAIIFISIGNHGFQDFISFLIPDIIPYAPLGGLGMIALGGFIHFAFSKNKVKNY